MRVRAVGGADREFLRRIRTRGAASGSRRPPAGGPAGS